MPDTPIWDTLEAYRQQVEAAKTADPPVVQKDAMQFFDLICQFNDCMTKTAISLSEISKRSGMDAMMKCHPDAPAAMIRAQVAMMLGAWANASSKSAPVIYAEPIQEVEPTPGGEV